MVLLPLFAALVVYGSVKNHSNERGEMGNEIGSESVFNAENAEAQEAQSGDGGIGEELPLNPSIDALVAP